MTDYEKQIIKRNEHWIKESKIQIANYQSYINHELENVKELATRNRIMKGRY